MNSSNTGWRPLFCRVCFHYNTIHFLREAPVYRKHVSVSVNEAVGAETTSRVQCTTGRREIPLNINVCVLNGYESEAAG